MRPSIIRTVDSDCKVSCTKYCHYFQIEECNQEVFEDVYTAYTDLLSQQCPSEDPDGFCYRTYQMGEGCVVSVKATCNLICNGTTGMCTWEVGFSV